MDEKTKSANQSLHEKSKSLSPIMWIGKNGLTENVLLELDKLLKKKKLVKVKLLRSYLDGKKKKDVALEIATKTNSQIINAIGFTITLYKR